MKWLNKWYQEQCNGEWEHTYGIKIETIDNPGWIVEIDIAETKYKGLECQNTEIENSASDWMHYKISDNKFLGFCSPNNLNKLFDVFKKLISTIG